MAGDNTTTADGAALPPDGGLARIAPPLADLRRTPDGPRERQLIHGATVQIMERRGPDARVTARRDGYGGWLRLTDLGPAAGTLTHRVLSPATHLYAAPRVQARVLMPLYLNARLRVIATDKNWAETPAGFVPARHLCPLDDAPLPPLTIARSLLHAPYLWGGNSVAGVDCSGLVQLAFHAANRLMPADSTPQRGIGHAITAGEEEPGDLIFWAGHVALFMGGDRIIHANGHAMCVAIESLSGAAARIAREGGGPVIARKRP